MVREEGKTPDLVVNGVMTEMKTDFNKFRLYHLLKKANLQSLEFAARHGSSEGQVAIDVKEWNRVNVGKVLSALDRDRPVAVQQGNLMATSFHPELTNDYRFHSYFLELAGGNSKSPVSRNGAS